MLCTSVTQAMVAVDPDAFAVGTDISHAFAGVTLSAVGPGRDSPSGAVFAIDPTTGGVESFNASTGSLAFGSDDGRWPTVWMDVSFLQLRVDFASPASIVMLDVIGNDSSDFGVLNAYDALDNLLDSAMTAQLGPNSIETLTVTAAGNVAYVVAGGRDGDSSVGLDNLWYDAAIPAPAAFVLGGIGVGLVNWLRRRRTL